jgi:hypothetical protein
MLSWREVLRQRSLNQPHQLTCLSSQFCIVLPHIGPILTRVMLREKIFGEFLGKIDKLSERWQQDGVMS